MLAAPLSSATAALGKRVRRRGRPRGAYGAGALRSARRVRPAHMARSARHGGAWHSQSSRRDTGERRGSAPDRDRPPRATPPPHALIGGARKTRTAGSSELRRRDATRPAAELRGRSAVASWSLHPAITVAAGRTVEGLVGGSDLG